MDVQEDLLQKLNEYGDNFLETHEVKKKKKKIKNKEAPEILGNTDKLSNDLDNSNIETSGDRTDKKKKRKKKKKKLESDPAVNIKPKPKHNSAGGAVRHIEQIKKELGLEDFKEEQLRKREEEEMKKKRLEMLNKKNQPEVVVFHSRKPKKQDAKTNVKDSAQTEKKENDDGLDLEAARYDVRKFGISGIKGEQKEDAMKDLLIRLGAKPPKNKFYNYKEYQELKQKQKNEFLEQKSWDRAVGNEVRGKGKAVKRKRDKNDIGAVDGQIGKFKSGVLFLKKNDIHSIKKAKVKR